MFGDDTRSDREFRKGMDFSSFRRKRQDDRFSLRKRQREEHLQKRIRQEKTDIKSDMNNTNDGFNDNNNNIHKQHKNIHTMIRELPNIVRKLQNGNRSQQVKAVGDIRLMLSHERSPPIDAVLKTGVLSNLIEIMSRDNQPGIQFEAAWAVTNIASGTNEHTGAVVNAGGIDAFIRLLRSGRDEILEQAVWGLGNIAGDSTKFRDTILKTGILPHLLHLATTVETAELLKNIIWTISNLVRNKPPFNLVRCAIVPLGTILRSNADVDVLVDCLWSFSYLSDSEDEESVQEIINSGVMDMFIKCLRMGNNILRQPTMRTLGNILTGTDSQTDCVLQCGFLDAIDNLLNSNTKAVRKECCWAISNVTAGTLAQLLAVINSGLIEKLVYCAQHDEYIVRREAGWALSNACACADFKAMQCLVEKDVIVALSSLFELSDQPKTIMMALEGLGNVLEIGEKYKNRHGYNLYVPKIEESGALDKIETLQASDVIEEIYDLTVNLVTTYWGEDTEDFELQQLNPKTDGNQFAFGSQHNSENTQHTANLFCF